MTSPEPQTRPEAQATRCRLYLITPPAIEPASFAGVLDDALSGGDVACVQLRAADADDAAVGRAAAALMPPCHARDVAFVIDGHVRAAAEAGADGVHLGDAAGVGAARRLLGADAIVGVSCGHSRHAGMLAAEVGADYVSFGANAAIVSWWSGLMEAPCVAAGGITVADCAALVGAGADFLAVGGAVWRDPAGPRAAVRAFNAAIESTWARC